MIDADNLTPSPEVQCPSGLRGLIRPLLVGDVAALSAKANRKSPDPLGMLFRNVWQKTLDPGVYAGEPWAAEGEGILNWENALVGDRSFLVFETRRVTYGDDFYFQIVCRHCRHKFEWCLNIADLEFSPLSDEARSGVEAANVKDAVFYRVLPHGGQRVGLRLLTGVHQRLVEKVKNTEGEGAMGEAVLLARFADIEGAKSPGERKAFVRSMNLLDLDYLRDEWEKLDIHVQDTVEVECPSCDGEQEIQIPTDERFFSPKSARPRRRKR